MFCHKSEYEDKKIIIFGTGNASERVIKYINTDIAYFVDNNSAKWGKTFLTDKLICSPQVLENESKDKILIVIASMYYKSIAEQLEDMGFTEGANYINGYGIIASPEEGLNSNLILPFFPLEKTEININGVNMAIVTHKGDKVLGGMMRGEIPICNNFLAELEEIQKVLKPHDKILDAGANIGVVAIVLAKTRPDVTIYCFEPDSTNYSILNINIMMNDIKNIRTFNYALGKTQEFINLYKNKTNFGDHRSCEINDSNKDIFDFEILESKVLKINPSEFFMNHYKDEIFEGFDIVKIDTQGADFDILEACMPLLKKDTKIFIEYSPHHLRVNGTTKSDVLGLLNKFTDIKKINPIGLSPRAQSISLSELEKFYYDQCDKYDKYYDIILSR